MIISGTGITTFTAKIKVDFQPVTTFSFMSNWNQLSSGKWVTSDRGYKNDLYEAKNVRIYGKENLINDLISQIELNRTAGSNQVYLSGFNSQEHVFGADVNYSIPILSEIFVDRRTQGTWKGFGLAVSLSAVSPSFIASSTALPLLRFLDIGYDADADRSINKFRTFANYWTNTDHQSDDGKFTGVFKFTDQEMIQLRRFIATQRSATVSITNILGVAMPFGRLSTSYPYNVKIVDFKDQGMFDNLYWKCSLTFALDTY